MQQIDPTILSGPNAPFIAELYARRYPEEVGGLVMVGYGMSRSLPLSAAVLFAWGLVASVFMNYAVALLQEHTEPRMIGRVMSMYSLVFFASAPLGHGQAGLITNRFGPQATLIVSGVMSAAIGVGSVALMRRVRALT